MRTTVTILICGALLAGTGCKKKGTDGGGGGWFVGEAGLMVNVDPEDETSRDYDLGAEQGLNAIACRYFAEAWVAGDAGTLLYTNDGGQDWTAHILPTTANLRAIATQDAGPVYLAGDGVFATAIPDEHGVATWQFIGSDTTNYRSVAAAARAGTVLAVDTTGGIWTYDRVLEKQAQIAGANAVAVAADGQLALVAGDGLARSTDGGRTWTPLRVDAGLVFDDVRFDRRGDAVAVGAGGVIARIDPAGGVLVQRVGAADLKTLYLAPSDDYSGVGYAAGIGGQIWITHDAGWTWEAGPNVGRTVLGADEIGEGHR